MQNLSIVSLLIIGSPDCLSKKALGRVEHRTSNKSVIYSNRG